MEISIWPQHDINDTNVLLTNFSILDIMLVVRCEEIVILSADYCASVLITPVWLLSGGCRFIQIPFRVNLII